MSPSWPSKYKNPVRLLRRSFFDQLLSLMHAISAGREYNLSFKAPNGTDPSCMLEHIDTLFYKLRYLTYGLLIIVGLLLFTLLLSLISNRPVQANRADTPSSILTSGTSDSANVITNAMVSASAKLDQSINSMSDNVGNSSGSIKIAASSVGNFATDSGSLIGHGLLNSVAFAGRGLGNGIGFFGKTVGSGLALVFHIPVNFFGFVSRTAVVSAAIRPADHTPVPIIENPTATAPVELKAEPVAAKAVPPAPPPAPLPVTTPVWPLHGAITTGFGVPELPYQAIHTGLDISDGNRAGGAPIVAFKPGRVIEAIRSGGLGNHVVLDNGSGMTSVYGHLTSISVQIGQVVDTTTTLGLEGSTGVSTGAHLHFEIRINGQPVNPLLYISGRP